MYTSLIAVTAALAATTSAFDCHGPYFSFYNRGGAALSYQRLDAALYPNAQSPHLHSFDGGNGLTVDMDYAATQASTCTTARIKPDKSLYWRPTLFWNGNNTGFYRVPEQYSKIYYKFGDSGNVRANVTEFPEGFKMIAGDAMLRSKGDNAAGIGWSCMRENDRIDTVGFPTGFTDCKNGYASQITFPACWNGKDIDPKNPSAHMAYPTNSGTGIGACPTGFQAARFPTIFIEFWYDISSFVGHFTASDQPFVLANGDPTGYGFHADFMNGWEKGVLAKAIAPTGYCDCGCGCGEDEMKTCFGSDQVNDDSDSTFKTCSATPSFPGEDTTPTEKLPGCNPLQSGPADATAVSGASCTAAASGAASSSNASSKPVSASVTSTIKSMATSAKAQAQDVSSQTVHASLSVSLAGKGDDNENGYGSATPSQVRHTASSSIETAQHTTSAAATSLPYSAPAVPTTAGVSDAGSLGLAFSDEATNWPSSKLAQFSTVPELATTPISAHSSETCQEQTTITITPTVYVTAGLQAETTGCAGVPTVYHTIRQITTVTVSAGDSYKHKRHMDIHKHHF